MATEWKDGATWTRAAQRPIVPARDPARDFDAATAYIARLGPGSRRTMREALAKLADWASDGRLGPEELAWHRLRRADTLALRARLASSLAPSTANKHLAALRGVLRQCLEHGLLTKEAYQEAIRLPPVRGRTAREPHRLRPDELQALEAVCRRDAGPAGARDEALLALLRGAGLRRSEAVALQLVDYDLRSGELRVRRGPRLDAPSRIRRVTTDDTVRNALERWILVRGAWPGPLLNPVNKGGRIERRRLSEQAIYIACQKRAAEAGLPPTSPEDLRRATGGRRARAEPTSPTHRTGADALPATAGWQTRSVSDPEPDARRRGRSGA